MRPEWDASWRLGMSGGRGVREERVPTGKDLAKTAHWSPWKSGVGETGETTPELSDV